MSCVGICSHSQTGWNILPVDMPVEVIKAEEVTNAWVRDGRSKFLMIRKF